VLVEPVDPVQGRQLEVVDASPRSVGTDALQLVEPDQALYLRIIVGVPDGAYRGDRSGVGEPLGVPDGDVLGSGVGVMDQPVESPVEFLRDVKRFLAV